MNSVTRISTDTPSAMMWCTSTRSRCSSSGPREHSPTRSRGATSRSKGRRKRRTAASAPAVRSSTSMSKRDASATSWRGSSRSRSASAGSGAARSADRARPAVGSRRADRGAPGPAACCSWCLGEPAGGGRRAAAGEATADCNRRPARPARWTGEPPYLRRVRGRCDAELADRGVLEDVGERLVHAEGALWIRAASWVALSEWPPRSKKLASVLNGDALPQDRAVQVEQGHLGRRLGRRERDGGDGDVGQRAFGRPCRWR